MDKIVNTQAVEVLTPVDITKRIRRGSKPMDYIPTDKEQSLLNVLTDPAHRLESVKRQAEIAGVSREYYYMLMRKPAFVAYYRELLQDVIKLHAASLINVAIDHAKSGSFQHLKLLMEMGGLYKQEVEHSGELNMVVSFVDPDYDDDEEIDSN